jgi:SPX domain protein involved in polyphosphate accumulation
VSFDGDSLRYERKFAVETPDAAVVRMAVKRHPAMFRRIYPPRNVNNIYLDTPALAAAHHNLEGMPDRWKARVRWYGPFWGTTEEAALELKRKHGDVGNKETYPLAGIEITSGMSCESLRAAIGAVPAAVRAVAALEPALANSYRREYYATPDRRFRATIDSNLSYLAIGHHRPAVRRRRYVVLEVKYDRRWDAAAHEICAEFPFRVTKFSKYADGLAMIGI